MTNPVLILSYNALPLLQKCVESVRAQDIPTELFIVDNGSKDSSPEWIRSQSIQGIMHRENTGVSAGWNWGLRYLFGSGAEHVLVLNQDCVLSKFFLSQLLNCNVPLVTGFPVESEDELQTFSLEMEPHPCFSAFLIRRDCWETVGEFDSRFFAWCNDCDYHARGHLLGVPMMKARIPFCHVGGTTIRRSDSHLKQWFIECANKDRAVFKSIYGCEPGEDTYADLFAEELFGVMRK